jgi:DNA ligase (NAD+)
MDIVGLGIKIVEQLVDHGLIGDIADLYTITRNDLLTLDGFAEKKADNLISAIEASKERSLQRYIYALGIDGVGEVVAGDLALAYQSIDRLAIANLDSLQLIEGIGPNIAQAIVKWFLMRPISGY